MDVIKLVDTPIGRQYMKYCIQGPFVRITTSQEGYISDGLKFWFKNTAPDVIKAKSDESKEKGTILHGYIANHLKGLKIDVQEEWAKQPMENFLKWLKGKKITPISIEQNLVSNRTGLGGTPDLICDYGMVNDVLIDFKTGEMRDEYRLQTALYHRLILDATGRVIKKRLIVSVPRDGEKIIEIECDELDKDLHAAFCTFERWKYENREVLKWARCPIELWEERKKTRGDKRTKFDETNYDESYRWPWLTINSAFDWGL